MRDIDTLTFRIVREINTYCILISNNCNLLLTSLVLFSHFASPIFAITNDTNFFYHIDFLTHRPLNQHERGLVVPYKFIKNKILPENAVVSLRQEWYDQ